MHNKSQDWLLLKRIFSMFIDYKIKIFIIFICLLVYLMGSFLTPFLSKMIIDNGVLADNYNQVVLFSSALFLLAIAHSVANIIKERIRITISLDVYKRLISNTFDALLDIKISYFSTKNSAEILNEIEVDTNNILMVFGENIFFAITQVLTFFGGIIGLFIIDYRMACIVFLFIPVKFFMVKVLGLRRRTSINKFIDAKNEFAHWFGDTLEGIKEVRSTGLENRQKNNLKLKIEPLVTNQKKLEILDVYNSDSEHIVYAMLESILYIIGVKFIFNGTITLGSLFAFISYSMYVVSPISSILNIHYSLAGVLPSAKRYYKFIDDAKQEKEISGNNNIEFFSSVEFSNVSFAYGDTPVLQQSNFSINHGEHVAIVGKNGSGKSTIFNLLQKFYEPESGEIILNGMNLKEYNKKSLRNLFSCVNQDSYLFDIGILENICLYKDVPEDLINKALKESLVDAFCEEKKQNGTGQNGSSLSGGQRQKVLIARLLTRVRPVYLLDEATANLDNSSETAIVELIKNTLRDKTVLMISHRQELLSAMDKILFISENGKVFTYNSYSELLHNQNLAAITL